MNGAPKPMRRSVMDRYVGGVCGGIAEYFGWDSTATRVGYVVLAVLGVGSPLLLYIVLWAVIPEREYY